jgi:hypothetical protein
MLESIHLYVNNERGNTETCTRTPTSYSCNHDAMGLQPCFVFGPRGPLEQHASRKMLAASNAIETISTAPGAF